MEEMRMKIKTKHENGAVGAFQVHLDFIDVIEFSCPFLFFIYLHFGKA